MGRVTQAMYERAAGGADKLLQLVDRDGTRTLSSTSCQAFIAEVTSEASDEVNSYISTALDLSDPALATAPLLIRYETTLGMYLFWQRGSSALAMPQEIRDARQDTIAAT